MVDYPTDSEGTVFDPALHNLLDEPARPELSKLGKFVKVRGNDGNDQDLIERYEASLAAQSEALDADVDKLVEDINKKNRALQAKAPKPVIGAEIDKDLLEKVAYTLRCEVFAIEGDVAVLQTIGRMDNIRGAARLGNDLAESLMNFSAVGIN